MMRLDAGFRIDATCDELHAGTAGGAVHTVLLAHGLYLSADDLAAELQTRLREDVDPAAAVDVVGGVFAIGWPTGTVTISWTLPRLRDWLGFVADVDAETSPVTAPAVCAGVFLPSLPWSGLSPLGWRVALARAPSWRGGGRSILRALHRSWSVTARAKASEVAQFRRVLGVLMAGLPGRLFLDVDTSSTWTATSAAGYVDVWLSEGDREYVERWMSAPSRLALEVELAFAEYVP